MASTLLLIPLDDTVVFPTMDVTLPVDPGEEERVLLVPRHEGEYARVGTIARVANRLRLPGGARGAHFEGVARGIAGAAGYAPDLTFEQKVELLETTDVTERLGTALRFQRERLAELQVRRRIREDVEEGAAKQQREYVLRKQMESIRRELGEDDGSFVDEYRAKIEEAGMPEAVREQAERELGRLERMGESSGESSMLRTYLDWLISVPWSNRSEDRLEPNHTREVLDPAQNSTFRDHYLDVELDLSEVVFIATANQAETIPGPLLDRMEVIRFDGYTLAEKTANARGYLWPRQRERNGLREDEVEIADEPGRAARGPQKVSKGAAARTAVPGVATGLAVTGTGGDVLFVEANDMKGSTGGLTLTGQLGDVMKESARIALTYVRAHARELGIDEEQFEDAELHVHVPAGAIPKDGPSAGVTMTTALASLLSGRPVRHT